MHLIEVKYCEDTRPGHQLEASRNKHEVLCKRLKAKQVILHTFLLGVGGSIFTSHTLDHLKELGLDTQKTHKAALKLHAHSVLYAHKLSTTRRALENFSLHAHSVLYAHKLSTTRRALENFSRSQGLSLEQGAACHPLDPHKFFHLPGGGDSRLFGPMCLLFLNWCREWFHCLRSFSFSFFVFLCVLQLAHA